MGIKTVVRKDYIKDAIKINEFKILLDNISSDDNKNIDDYTKDELQKEANYLIEKLQMDLDDTCDDEVRAIKDINSQMAKIKEWINKYK